MLEVLSQTNPLAPDNEKDDPKYGRTLMQAAVTSWQTGYNGESRTARKNRFDYNRSYALGKYDMAEFKDVLDLDGELSVVNLPYDPLPIAKPFLNRLKDRYNQRDEIIQCDAIDPFVTGKKKEAKDAAIFKLQQVKNIQALMQQSGVQTEEFSDNDPQSLAEIDVEFGFNYKEREEVIMENLINMVFYENDWTGVVKDRLMDDLINCGYAGTKVYIDGTGRIKIRFIKPENLITSYTEWNDFRDWQYVGDISYLSITEVRMKYPGKVSEKELFELAQNLCGKYGNSVTWGLAWNANWVNAIARPYDAWNVPIVELHLKTLYNLKKSAITDKFGKEIIKPTNAQTLSTDTITPLESPPYYVDYTGVLIPDTDHVLAWGLSKNMVKENLNLQEIISTYIVYMYDNTEMTNKPLMEMIIPSIKKMTLYELQQLKIVAAAAPDGYDVDIALMSDISLDGGLSQMSPLDLYSVYKQTGIRYFKSIPDEGMEGGQRRVPISANNVPFSSKLQELENLKMAEFLRITNLISNELDAGNIRNQAVSQEVVKEAKVTGESTSNYIYDSFLNIMRRTANVVKILGWDILMYGKKFGMSYYDGYRQALGTNRVEYLKLEATDDWAKSAFDIQIRTVVGDADNLFLEQNMQQALAQQTITLADAIDVRELARTNVKYASYVLAQRIDKRSNQKQQEAMQLAQQNTQSAVAGAQEKNQGDMALAQFQDTAKQGEDQRAHNAAIAQEEAKFNSILKVEIAKSVLSQPGAKISDIPSFVFEGLPLEKALDHSVIMNYLQTAAQQQQQTAQQIQAQAAQTNANTQQQNADAQQPNEGLVNQTVA